MTVGEFIEKLQTFDPTARAVVAGWHFGYDDIAAVNAVVIAPAPDAEDWDGEFQDAEGGEPAVYICSRDPKITSFDEFDKLPKVDVGEIDFEALKKQERE